MHRTFQLFWDISDKAGVGITEMHHMHFQDDSGVVDIPHIWMVAVQMAAVVWVCHFDILYFQVQLRLEVSGAECLASFVGVDKAKGSER